MTLEFEAASKADAERKARASGMDVQHVQDITTGVPAEHHGSRHRGVDRGRQTGLHPILKLLLIVAVLGGIVWFAWPYIRAVIGM